VDAFLGLDMVSEELIAAIQPFEPHGLGNPAPVFAARGVRIAVQRPFGHDQAHLRLLLDDAMPATFWNGVHHAQQIGWQDGDHLDVVYQLEWDAYRQRPALLVKDVGSIF
jgi:single-stranded-DNA-specific exonuclease